MRGDEGLYLCCQPCSSGPLSPVTRTLFSAISTSPPVLPEAHGGGLDGFFLLRGDQDRLARIRSSEEFERLTVRAQLIVENFGIVGAAWAGGSCPSCQCSAPRWKNLPSGPESRTPDIAAC